MKCQFAKSSVIFLGHVITASGIQPNPEKVVAVLKFPVPTSVKVVRQFMGMAN